MVFFSFSIRTYDEKNIPKPIPAKENPEYVTLTFAGDIMLDRGVRNSVNKHFNGDYSQLFNNLDILKQSDITFVNLEGPVSDKGKDRHNKYSFRMSPEVLPAIYNAGIDIVSIANNHIGDWGVEAFKDTVRRLKENNILFTGGNLNDDEAFKPTVIEKNGIKIGYLALSDVGPNWMGIGKDNGGILLANNENFDEIISTASKEVDVLIVSFHFGEEYKLVHNSRQEYLAHKAIDDGAKIIIGSHPHVIEDTEEYHGGYIAYSLGNLIFDQYFSKNTMQGMILEITYNKNGTISVRKDKVTLSKVFQPETVTIGEEEK